MNHPHLRSALAVSLLAFLSLATLSLSGCSGAYPTVEGQMSYSMVIEDSPVISVRSTNGGIKVVRGSDPDMLVEATIRARSEERLNATRIVSSREADGSYSVTVAWPDDKRLNNEGAEFLITVPGASELKLESSNGAFNVEGLDAAVYARTSNGSVRVIGPARSVDAVTSNGTINIEGVTGEVTARSSNGWVRLMLDSENPGPVVLTTSNGNLTLGVGTAFDSEVELTTSNGGLNVDGFATGDAPAFFESRRNYLRLGFGDATHRSTLRTSNGSVTVQPL